MERLILHEHHVANFEPVHEILDRRAQVATASPHIFNKRDLIWVNTKSLGEPAIVELDTLLFEEVVLFGVVEHLDAHHDEARVVSPRDANVVQVVEASAKLRTNQRICWWVQLTRHAVGLEAENARGDIIYIVAPTSHHRIPFNRGARDSS